MAPEPDLYETADRVLEMVKRLKRERAALLDAAKLTVLHFKRNQVGGNFQCDDEHEAWTALASAIAQCEET